MTKKIIVIMLLLIGLAGSGYVAYERGRVETRNKAVELVLDYAELSDMASATGTDLDSVFSRFKKAGATSVAVAQMTFSEALADRLILPISTNSFMVKNSIADSVKKHLQILLPYYSQIIFNSETSQGYTWVTLPKNIPISYLNGLPIGFPEGSIDAAKDAGFEVIARLVSYPNASPASINMMFKDLRNLGIKKIIFQGDTILGFKGAEDETSEALISNGIYFGRVEFSKQKGELKVAAKAKQNVITVHSITQAEMPAMDLASIVERFQKAVREREIKMCYVRMYYTSSADIICDNVSYIEKIAKSITKAGYELKSAHPLDEITVPKTARIAAGLGVAAGCAMLLFSIFEMPMLASILWILLFTVICGCLAAFGESGRKLIALLSALIFPTLAVLSASKNTPDSKRNIALPYGKAVLRMLVAVLTVACGGFFIVGLLSEQTYMLRVNQFFGVKAAHLLPVMLLAVLYGGGIAWKPDFWKSQKKKMIEQVKSIASNPVLVWHTAAVFFVLVIVGIMVARSGNDSGVGVSDFELRFRSILDKFLYVRPRTKEFLLGYPALLFGIAFALKGVRKIAAPLLVLGSIALISTLNTFCHIHTPLELSVLRVVNGVWVSLVVGSVLYLVIRKYE